MSSAFLGEFLGTMTLILLGNSVNGTVLLKGTYGENSGWMVIATGWGLAVIFGVIVALVVGSNAHINPAVTLGVSVATGEWDHVGTYVDEYNVGTIHVTRTEAGLGVEMPDLEELGYTVEPDLLTYADTIFWLTIDGQAYDLTFIGMPGEPSGFVKNRAFAGTRNTDID